MVCFYLSTVIGGGVVDGTVAFGGTGHADAVDAIPLSLSAESEANPAELLEAAALACFEELCARTADALAFAAITGKILIEAAEVALDGVLHRSLRHRLRVQFSRSNELCSLGKPPVGLGIGAVAGREPLVEAGAVGFLQVALDARCRRSRGPRRSAQAAFPWAPSRASPRASRGEGRTSPEAPRP
jgi:organic hydroperoxide reductase OsmC/OhrA